MGTRQEYYTLGHDAICAKCSCYNSVRVAGLCAYCWDRFVLDYDTEFKLWVSLLDRDMDDLADKVVYDWIDYG